MAETAGTATLDAIDRPQRSQTSQMFRAFRRDKAAVISAIILLFVAGAAILAPILPLDDPLEGDPRQSLEPMGTAGHPFGTDKQGRDILSRVVWGGRASLPLALLPVIFSTIVGLGMGVTAAFMGGPGSGRWGRFYDQVVMRVIDILFAFPTVVLAITVAAFLGNGPRSVIIASTIVLIPPIARVAYAATREQLGRDFVLAATALGASELRVMARHILPNMIAPVIVYVTTLIGLMVVFTAGLSFLGLGIQPPNPEWGLMVSQGKEVLNVAPNVAGFPGLAIAIVALAFNLVGDGLRYAFDPRTRNL